MFRLLKISFQQGTQKDREELFYLKSVRMFLYYCGRQKENETSYSAPRF